ncbi:MAG TPA: 30S ribosomal protein S6 [Abditibacteriaceae bacterium]
MAEDQNTVNGTAEADATETTSDNSTTTDAQATEATEAQATETPAAEVTEAPQTETVQAEAPQSEERPAEPARINVPQPELSDALSQTSNNSDEPRKDVPGGRPYEIIYIARTGDNEANDATSKNLRELVDTLGGAVDNIRASESRRLAYPIKREAEGIYTVVNARFTTDHLSEVDRFFKLEESVLRHMILKEEV